MVDDLKARLRRKTITHTNAVGLGFQQVSHCTLDPDCHEAADRIEELEAENARLRRSLPPVQNSLHRGGGAR